MRCCRQDTTSAGCVGLLLDHATPRAITPCRQTTERSIATGKQHKCDCLPKRRLFLPKHPPQRAAPTLRPILQRLIENKTHTPLSICPGDIIFRRTPPPDVLACCLNFGTTPLLSSALCNYPTPPLPQCDAADLAPTSAGCVGLLPELWDNTAPLFYSLQLPYTSSALM